MAGQFVDLVLTGLQDDAIPPSAKLVAVALANHANVGSCGIAWPSVKTLSRETGISTGRVREHLRKLEAREWVMREGRRGGGRGLSTRYRINLARMEFFALRNPP